MCTHLSVGGSAVAVDLMVTSAQSPFDTIASAVGLPPNATTFCYNASTRVLVNGMTYFATIAVRSRCGPSTTVSTAGYLFDDMPPPSASVTLTDPEFCDAPIYISDDNPVPNVYSLTASWSTISLVEVGDVPGSGVQVSLRRADALLVSDWYVRLTAGLSWLSFSKRH
jgi:hypothetical protein